MSGPKLGVSDAEAADVVGAEAAAAAAVEGGGGGGAWLEAELGREPDGEGDAPPQF